MAYRMAEVLQWDVDFNKDLQRGDTFAALYEEVRLDSATADRQRARGGARERRRRLEAYRFGDAATTMRRAGRSRRCS